MSFSLYDEGGGLRPGGLAEGLPVGRDFVPENLEVPAVERIGRRNRGNPSRKLAMDRNDIGSCGRLVDPDQVRRNGAASHLLDIRLLQGDLQIDGSLRISLLRRFHLSQEVRRAGTRAEQF